MGRRLRGLRKRDQSGMTLIELLLAMSIMVLIIGTVTALIAFVARSTQPTSSTAVVADDVMLASALWAQDVVHAQKFSGSSSYIGTNSGCTYSGTAIGWFYYKTGVSTFSSSVIWSYSGAKVIRKDCVAGTTQTLVSHLSAGATPSITCLNGSGSTVPSCTQRAASTGTQVTLTITTTTPQNIVVSSTPVLNGAWMITCSTCVADGTVGETGTNE